MKYRQEPKLNLSPSLSLLHYLPIILTAVPVLVAVLNKNIIIENNNNLRRQHKEDVNNEDISEKRKTVLFDLRRQPITLASTLLVVVCWLEVSFFFSCSSQTSPLQLQHGQKKLLQQEAGQEAEAQKRTAIINTDHTSARFVNLHFHLL